jgi:hypothetical protein
MSETGYLAINGIKTSQQVEQIKFFMKEQLFIHSADFFNDSIFVNEISISCIKDIIKNLVKLQIEAEGEIEYDCVDLENERFKVFLDQTGEYNLQTISFSNYQKNLGLGEIVKLIDDGADLITIKSHLEKTYKPLFDNNQSK